MTETAKEVVNDITAQLSTVTEPVENETILPSELRTTTFVLQQIEKLASNIIRTYIIVLQTMLLFAFVLKIHLLDFSINKYITYIEDMYIWMDVLYIILNRLGDSNNLFDPDSNATNDIIDVIVAISCLKLYPYFMNICTYI